jgi:hypothetical protein
MTVYLSRSRIIETRDVNKVAPRHVDLHEQSFWSWFLSFTRTGAVSGENNYIVRTNYVSGHTIKMKVLLLVEKQKKRDQPSES